MITEAHKEQRRDFARLLLGLQTLGYHLIFIDEHSVNEKDGKFKALMIGLTSFVFLEVSPYMWLKGNENGRYVTARR